jgi:subtilisin family serine protease
MKRLAFIAVLALVGLVSASAAPGAVEMSRYNVVLAGSMTESGFQAAGDISTVRTLIATAGGVVAIDLSKQIGVFVVDSPNAAIVDLLRSSGLVEEAAADQKWKGLPDGGPQAHSEMLESQQWSMQMIRTGLAHSIQAGAPSVEVAVIDSGVDANHVDLMANVNCAKGRDFIALGPQGSLGTPGPCVDNLFHGTHVAGIIAAKANTVGVVGVAPNVTIVPIKVCDTPEGYCYASATAAGITYAGDAKVEVANMSFFVDDDALQASTEVKCDSDPEQRAFKKANERALKYARSRGVTLVAAAGNSNRDLAALDRGCAVVPAMSPGVIAVTAVTATGQKASYSSYGSGYADVAAPGGAANGACQQGVLNAGVLSTIPGAWGCFAGTSMASPHAAGVAALIVSQFGKVRDGDVVMSPDAVEDRLKETAVDIGAKGYDEYFGHGLVDALNAVRT